MSIYPPLPDPVPPVPPIVVPFFVLDATTAEPFAAWLGELVVPEGADLVLDLGRVKLLTAAGIGVLARLDARQASRRSRLVLVNFGIGIGRVLSVCDLDRRWSGTALH